MADLVPEVLEQLSSILALGKRRKVSMAARIQKDVKNLMGHLGNIRAELADAEKKEWKHSSIKDWLDKLREFCYDMEDLLDEWSTTILKAQHEHYPPNPQRKVCSFIRSCCFCYDQVDDLLRGRIRNLNEKVDEIVMDKIGYGFNFEKSTEQQFTPSTIEVPLIRETDMNKIKDLLIRESSEEINVIFIVGKEGIGKSALARQVFLDDRVKEHLEKTIWVRVNPFDLSKIRKTIFASIFESLSSHYILEDLGLDDFWYPIWGKKFLLVLDDVRAEDYPNSKKLINSLLSVSGESKILVTAREENIVIVEDSLTIIKSTTITLEQFSEKECWSLFTEAALFHKRSSSECTKLEEIGRKVEKCDRSPLAILTVGSLLRLKKSTEEWQSVLNSGVWELKEVVKGRHFAPLLLSYYDLPPKIKRCFSYCAIFPKSTVFVKDQMIKLWMAQGYIRATQSKEMEIIGQDCFDNLAAYSFFQDFIKDRNGNVITFMMPDMICDFAKYLAKNECVNVEVSGSDKEASFSWKEARHLQIKLLKKGQVFHTFDGLKKLRSLLVEFESHSILDSDFLNKLTCLRALKLSKFSDGIVASEIGTLIHLRHLDLSDNDRLIELPEKVCELYNLQTLDVSRCTSLVKLPSGIGKLINLRYLKKKDTEKLTFMPKGIERLSSLKELDEFVVSTGVGYDGEAAAILGDVGNLNQLGKYLKLRGLGNVRDADQACKAQLKNRNHLIALTLNFDSRKEMKGKDYDNKVIERLELHPNLEYLEINDYIGINLPSWMLSLTKLWKLHLFNCMNCEHLPPLGKLPSLEYLEIRKMQSVKKVGVEFLGIAKEDKGEIISFPELRELRFSEMEEWEDWDAEEKDIEPRITIMPSLLVLDIQDCPKLKALPVQIIETAQKELHFNKCSRLTARYQPGGEDWEKNFFFPIVKIDEKRKPRFS